MASYPWGIDFGNSNCVVAVARRGGIDILANEASNRQTPCLVGFADKQRVVGEAGAAQWQSNVKNTISNIKQLIGRKWAEPSLQALRASLPFKIVEGENGGIAVQVTYNDGDAKFSPEQILAMLLKNLMRTAEVANQGPSPDAVISVPAYFTDGQRRIVMDAAQIAGIHVLRLMNETAAAALAYGLPKSLEFPEDGQPPRNVLFFDMGQSATTVCAVAYTKSKLQVLSTSFDKSLGGSVFDELLTDHFIKEFNAKYKLNLHDSPKAVHRLRQMVQKLKVNLSGVPRLQLHVECLYEDHDFQSEMTRESFDALVAPVMLRVLEPVKQVLADSDLKFDQIHSIQLVGSATRMPCIISTLKDFFGKEPGRELNSEECIAKGCAIAAAMISPTFKVREFSVVDASPYGINLSWTSSSAPAAAPATPADDKMDVDTPATGSGSLVFAKNNVIPSSKILTFARNQSFEITAAYAEPAALSEGVNPFICHFTISDIPPTEDGTPAKVKVKVRLDPHGILSIEQAWAVQEYEVEEEVVVDPKKDAKAAPAAAAAPAPAAAAPADAAAPEAAAPKDDTDLPDAPPVDAAAPAAAPAPAEPKKETVMKKKIRKQELKIKGSADAGLDKEVLRKLKEAEFDMAAQDRWIQETHDKRNELESYVYAMRDDVTSRLSEFMPEADKTAFIAALDEMENWFYSDEIHTAQKGQFQEKLDSLKKLGDPVITRQKEFADRAVAVEQLQNAILEFRGQATSQDDKYMHIDGFDRQKVTKECDAAEAFLKEKVAAQEGRSKDSDPAFKAEELRAKAVALGTFCRPIMSRPKPAPKPKPEEKKEDKPADGEAKPEGEAKPADGSAAPAADGDAAPAPAADPMDETLD